MLTPIYNIIEKILDYSIFLGELVVEILTEGFNSLFSTVKSYTKRFSWFILSSFLLVMLGINNLLRVLADVNAFIEVFVLLLTVMILEAVFFLFLYFVYLKPHIFILILVTIDCSFSSIFIALVFFWACTPFPVPITECVIALAIYKKLEPFFLKLDMRAGILNITDIVISFFKAYLYWPFYVLSIFIWPIFVIFNGVVQSIWCPALLYSYKKHVINDRSDIIGNKMTFSWGGMFHSAGMNAEHFSSPSSGLHIAFSHRFSISKQSLAQIYLDEIKTFIRNHPDKMQLQFCGYSLGGSVVVEVLSAFLEDKEIDPNKFNITLVLDRTFKSLEKVLGCSSTCLEEYFTYGSNVLSKADSFCRGNKLELNLIQAREDWILGDTQLSSKDIRPKKLITVDHHLGNGNKEETFPYIYKNNY